MSPAPTPTLLLATCRAEPFSHDPHDHVPLPAGAYRFLVVKRPPPAPSAMPATPWRYPVAAMGRRVARTVAPRLAARRWHCRTCEHEFSVIAGAPDSATEDVRPGTPAARATITDLCPTGDVILVVHGFNCTEESGIETAFNVHDALAAWGLPLAPPPGMLGAPHDHREDGHSCLSPGGQAWPPHEEQIPRSANPQVIGFTWPCEHTLFPGYMADKEAVARFAAFSLANLITDLRARQPQRRIHIVAHSMGCFLTLKALNMLAVLHGIHAPAATPLVDSVIWLAADINADALERSTPATLPLHAWRHPAHVLGMARLRAIFTRPRPLADPPLAAVPTHTASPASSGTAAPVYAHPLDGYGYAALDVVGDLTIYSSFRDEALWASPLANLTTEESGGTAWSIRLGWCGPLHPRLMMVPDGTRPRRVTLVDCTDCITEHGMYFFVPAVQRDLAARLDAAQRRQRGDAAMEAARVTAPGGAKASASPRRPGVARRQRDRAVITPPPERVSLTTWRAGRPLAFPSAGHALPEGLTLAQLRRLPLGAQTPPRTDRGAPAIPPQSATAFFAALWRWPLTAALLAAWVGLWRWYFRV